MPGQAALHLLSATQILSLLKDDLITVEDYAHSLLHRIDQRNDIVKAWAYLDMPTEFGCSLYQGNQPSFDSSAVSILRNAGALIFGKTTTSELTWLNSGPQTTNPHDVNRTPGGSSTGSAAAVADFQVPLSIGTQTGGSLIRPASYTGTFAMKPTYNAISLEGQKICSISLDTLGFFARSIEDLQLLADVFSLKNTHPHKIIPIREPRIAFMQTPMWDQAGPGTINAMDTAFTILHNRGIKVDQVPLPPEYTNPKMLIENFNTIYETEAQSSFRQEYNMDKSKLHPEIRALVETPSCTSQQYSQALDYFTRIRKIFTSPILTQYDAILTPSVPDEAPPGLHDMGSSVFNFFWSSIHMPVLNIPAFVGPNKMPIGLSFIAAPFCDQQLLHLAKSIADSLMSDGGWKIDLPV
ncbi:uncharacterized protein EAE98_010259 [Botrytis deweyae]|uniref:Amidase domain-containing protein n=1 Tax=Botrytis deweyae TaxID=2478750 RepID=A0ABQ7I920_9HELO|nr:uncharacterized protein EAE98_010259 [Botrytis deweyae]KAF7917154.1 hypothetical protein EAE98_010259 [Botrytis deweyae]